MVSGLMNFADSFNKGLTGGIGLFQALQQQQATQQQAALSNQIQFENLGYTRAKFFQDQQTANANDPLGLSSGGTSLSPGLLQGGGYQGLAPQQAFPSNQLFTPANPSTQINQAPNSTPTSPEPVDPQQALVNYLSQGTKIDPKHFKTDIPYKTPNVLLWAAQQRQKLDNYPKTYKDQLSPEVDRLQSALGVTENQKAIEDFQKRIPDIKDLILKPGEGTDTLSYIQRKHAILNEVEKLAQTDPGAFGYGSGLGEAVSSVGPFYGLRNTIPSLKTREKIDTLSNELKNVIQPALQKKLRNVTSDSAQAVLTEQLINPNDNAQAVSDKAKSLRENNSNLFNTILPDYSNNYIIPDNLKTLPETTQLQTLQSNPEALKSPGMKTNLTSLGIGAALGGITGGIPGAALGAGTSLLADNVPGGALIGAALGGLGGASGGLFKAATSAKSLNLFSDALGGKLAQGLESLPFLKGAMQKIGVPLIDRGFDAVVDGARGLGLGILTGGVTGAAIGSAKQLMQGQPATKVLQKVKNEDGSTAIQIDLKRLHEINNSQVDTSTLIKKVEGFRDKAYQDENGTWIAGYGSTSINGQPVTQDTAVSKQEAEQQYQNDVSAAEKTIEGSIQAPLSPKQKEALTSFIYNAGPTAFLKNIAPHLNNGNLNQAIANMSKFIHVRDGQGGFKVSQGLINRRNKEIAMLVRGN